MRPHRLAIVTSHVIQYQDPLFRLIAQQPDIDVTVFFCSRHGAEVYRDEDMKTSLQWDIDLLEGYRHVFLRNLSRSRFDAGFTRLINPGIIPALARGRFDMVVFMMGWGSVTAWLGFAACLASGTPFFLYGDSSFPPPVSSVRGNIRDRILRTLFRAASGFMVSGHLNAEYYRHYGADPATFFLLPWAVDNERFERASAFAAGERAALRARLGIPDDATVFVYSAKLVPRKDPMTLLRAYASMKSRDRAALLFLGDGELRPEMEAFAGAQGLKNVVFAGFVNQTELPKMYAAGEVFVLPSLYEPRGAVLNEAMACGLPLIVTDRCGSLGDIALPGENTLVYDAGDAQTLARHMDTLTGDSALRRRMAGRSREIIGTWNYARGVEGIRQALGNIRRGA